MEVEEFEADLCLLNVKWLVLYPQHGAQETRTRTQGLLGRVFNENVTVIKGAPSAVSECVCMCARWIGSILRRHVVNPHHERCR